MLELTRRHNVAVRGHNVFWEDPNYQSWWLKSLLSPPTAATPKMTTLSSEHYSLGKEESARFFKVVNYIDRHGIPFLNEFNTIETPSDQAVAPPKRDLQGLWITELDVKSNQNQAVVLEQVMREAHAHPAIGGIIVWSAWRPEGDAAATRLN
ncbi:hypothetical protein Leryth_002129 [Lithospermum erythrorhizon]|nr:hypothetical protein Leryth_002129 [Lithospermum erythrorhizon]